MSGEFLAGLFLFVGVTLLFLHARKQGADEDHYLAWGHSFFLDRDLFLYNQFEALRLPFHLTPTGYVAELRNFGVALFWQPFYQLAALASSPEAAGFGLAVAGKNLLLFLNWSTFVVIAVAGLLVNAALRRYFSGRVIWLTLLIMFMGTPLGYYTLQRPLSSHPLSILLASLLLFLLVSSPIVSEWRYFAAGVVVGWLMLVASYNVALLLVPLTMVSAGLAADRNWRRFFVNGLALASGAILGFLPQMIGWNALYGGFLASPYSGQLQWLNPRIFETLFSPFHGLFVYAPALLLAPVGLFLFYRTNRAMAVGMALSWLALSYIAAANLAWWAGASFGNRYFLGLTPFFALMLAALLQQSRYWLLPLLLCVAWSFGLWLQTLDGTLKIGDASFYSIQTLALNQLTAFQNFPLLVGLADSHWLNTFSVGAIAVILAGSVIVFIGSALAIQYWRIPHSKQSALVLFVLALLLVITTTWMWRHSEYRKKQLIAAGFYQKSHRVSAYDPIDLSKTYLDRADYYQFTGQTDLILPDLQSATQSWFTDSRQILGETGKVLPELTQPLYLNFGPEIQLTGYHWREPDSLLTLYWAKSANVTENSYVPVIRILDSAGDILWTGQPDDPFPARYIPAGYTFSDEIVVDSSISMPASVWVQIDLGKDYPPQTVDRQPHSGIFPLQSYSGDPQESSFPNTQLPSELILPGDDLLLQPYWPSDEAARFQPYAEVRLLKSSQDPVFTQPVTLLLQNSWDAARRQTMYLRDGFCVQTPPSLPPGAYRLELLVDRAGSDPFVSLSEIDVANVDSGRIQKQSVCSQLNLAPERKFWPIDQPVLPEAEFDSQIVLLGHSLELVTNAAQPLLQIGFNWLSLVNNPALTQPTLRLIDGQDQTVTDISWTPVWGTRPVEYWFQNEMIFDTIQLAIPDLPAGTYKLIVEWQSVNPDDPEAERRLYSYVVEEFGR